MNILFIDRSRELDGFIPLLFLQQDNAIAYWRKFVAEYYSHRAKKRWCLSLYENVGQHALGVFPQAAMVCSSAILICILFSPRIGLEIDAKRQI